MLAKLHFRQLQTEISTEIERGKETVECGGGGVFAFYSNRSLIRRRHFNRKNDRFCGFLYFTHPSIHYYFYLFPYRIFNTISQLLINYYY